MRHLRGCPERLRLEVHLVGQILSMSFVTTIWEEFLKLFMLMDLTALMPITPMDKMANFNLLDIQAI
jgi:hypothetical protein